MPAIQLTRLKQQSALIATSFDRPQAFISGFHAVLNFYADRTFRPGQSGTPSTLLPAYNVPKPVLRQVVSELAPLIQQDPQKALTLCDALWEQDNYECKLLAASILSYLPFDQTEAVIERAQAWLPREIEPRLIHTFFDQSLEKLRTLQVEEFQAAADRWLDSSNLNEKKLGLRALLALAEDDQFHNLPYVLKKISPFVKNAHPRLRATLVEVVRACARRSPGETAYFLKQTLIMPENPTTAWVARQVLKEFPAEIEQGLREALRS